MWSEQTHNKWIESLRLTALARVVARAELAFQAGFSRQLLPLQQRGGYLPLEDLNRACPQWKRSLFALLTSFGTNLEVARGRLRSFEMAFTLEEVEELLKRSGFEIIKGEAGLSLFVLAAKPCPEPHPERL